MISFDWRPGGRGRTDPSALGDGDTVWGRFDPSHPTSRDLVILNQQVPSRLLPGESAMSTIPSNPQYLTDGEGRRVGVLIGLDQYRQLLDALEEIESIRAYDEAKASGEEAIRFDQAVEAIERERDSE